MNASSNNMVGPIMRGGELAEVMAEVAEMDNPDKDIHVTDRNAYVRIEAEHELQFNRSTIEEVLGRPFKMSELEIELGSFAGQIEVSTDHVRFYFTENL